LILIIFLFNFFIKDPRNLFSLFCGLNLITIETKIKEAEIQDPEGKEKPRKVLGGNSAQNENYEK